MRPFLTLAFLLTLLATNSHGAVWDVPGEVPTIQAAIDSASAGDTVLVADGVYTGFGNRDIDFGGKAIVLSSVNGPAVTIIDCQASVGDRHRGVYFGNGEASSTELIGLTIQGGYAPPESIFSFEAAGGAVVCFNSSPTIKNCVFKGNTTSFGGSDLGGAVACKNASPMFVACLFDSNTASRGGGFACDAASPTLAHCSFTRNTAIDGSGMYCTNGANPSLTGCAFDGNTPTMFASPTRGVGLFCMSSAPSLDSCSFNNNSGSSLGGGVCLFFSSPSLSNCSFLGNAAGSGGGIYCESSLSTPLIDNCEFQGNTANARGGAICCAEGTAPILRKNTLSGNTAGRLDGFEGLGGGIYCAGSSPVIEENTIEGNEARGLVSAYGGAICLEEGSNPTITKNVMRDNSAEAQHLHPTAIAGGGAICIDSSAPIIGGSPGNGNLFERNRSWSGMDLYKAGGGGMTDARYNQFTIFPPSAYYVRAPTGFDVSGGTGTHSAIIDDVTVSPAGSDSVPRAAGQVTFLTIQAALGRIAPSAAKPVTINVEAGQYSPSATGEVFPLPLIDYVSIIGRGFKKSIVDAEAANRVFYCDGVESARVEGLTIRGGRSGMGGGILLRESSVQIDHDRFIANTAIWGGAIASTGNSASSVQRTVIVSNSTLSSPSFAKLGGGLFCDNGSVLVIGNSLIAFNTSIDYGGGIAINQSAEAMITNTTITMNEAAFGGAVLAWNDGIAGIENCVLWSNIGVDSTDSIMAAEPAATEEISLCCGAIANVAYSTVTGGWAGDGNSGLDPMIDPGGRFYLLAGSPAIDAGNPEPAFNDLEDPHVPSAALFPSRGTLRNDMGAYGGPLAKDLFSGSRFEPTPIRETKAFAKTVALREPLGEASVGLTVVPNPIAGGRARIRFQSPRDLSRFDIGVFDCAGRKVATLLLGSRPAGVQDLEWDASDASGRRVAPGIYFLRLKTDGQCESRRVTVLR